jgi:transketolase
LRIGRQPVPELFNSEDDINLNKVQVLLNNDAPDICFVTSGCVLHDVLDSVNTLKEKGLKIAVLNVHTIKPFDEKTIVEFANKSKNVVTVEDHSIIGGLGSAVCETLSTYSPKKVLRIGLNDVFPESAPPKDLYRKYGLDCQGILKKVISFIE